MNEKTTTNRELEEKYRHMQPIYKSLGKSVKKILEHAISNDVRVHSIESRVKKTESFLNKARKCNEDGKSTLKYDDPLSQITDIAGIRVIVFFPKSLEEIDRAITTELELIEKKDIGEERFQEGKFGYQSIHYLVKMPEKRLELTENRDFDGLTAEIQVRTILQHAWAEMEHEIQYKSAKENPSSIQRRFLALAGMIEIADSEFQSIQDEDSKIRLSVSTSLQDDYGNATGQADISPMVARTLIADKNYQSAIDHYSNLIEQQPDSYTLYIGRAKARFLNGSRLEAIEDLNTAKELKPDDIVIDKLRAQIEEGVLDNAGSASEAWQFSTTANKVLAKGDAEEAFKMYSKAQALGFKPFFSVFNKAMASALSKDVDGTNYFLDQITPNKGSPSELNVIALRAIVAHIGKTGYTHIFKKLEHKLIELAAFDFNQSPLRHLKDGFQNRDGQISQEILDVFELLENEKT